MVMEERVREQLIRLLSGKPEIIRVILFGSRARGDADERSDIDLAIEAPAISQRQWLDLIFLFDQIDTLLPVDIGGEGSV